MATAYKNGLDFIKVGETYQYVKSRTNIDTDVPEFVAMITILQDESDSRQYFFIAQIEKATSEPNEFKGIIEIQEKKGRTDVYYTYTGTPQLFGTEVCGCEYAWDKSMLPPISKVPDIDVLEESFRHLTYLYNKFLDDDCTLSEEELPEMLKVVDLLKQAEAKMQEIYDSH